VERGLCVSGFRGLFFCKMDVISEFAVSAKDCGEIFFHRSWACNFWMVGVIRDTLFSQCFCECFLGFLVFEAFRVVQGARGG